MHEDGVVGWLQSARSSLTSHGFQAVALVALDRPTITGRMWSDGSLQPPQIQEMLAAYAADVAAHGILEGARAPAAYSRPNASGGDRSLAVVVAPKMAPRVAAIVRATPSADLNSAVQLLANGVPRDEVIEMASAISEVTGAAAVLVSKDAAEFVSRAAFVQQGLTGPFLGLSCVSRQAGDAVLRLQRAVTDSAGSSSVRKEQVGHYIMGCFVKRIGENNLAIAATRFGLTRAELAEAESMIAGLSCKESASRLKISPETVRQRRKVIYRKLGVESCGTAVARILELELPPPPSDTGSSIASHFDAVRQSGTRSREI